MRQRILEVVFKSDNPRLPQYAIIFNLIYLVFLLLPFLVPAINPGLLLNVTGAICCFFFIYIIPTLMHIQCYHGEENDFITTVRRKISEYGIIPVHVHNHAEEHP